MLYDTEFANWELQSKFSAPQKQFQKYQFRERERKRYRKFSERGFQNKTTVQQKSLSDLHVSMVQR